MAVNPFSSLLANDQDDSTREPRGGLSYVSGRQDEALSFTTVSQLLDHACELNGGGDAATFIEQNTTLSWYSLRDRADELAAALLAHGVTRGDRVAIWAPNRLEWLITQFGTARIGAILVNINPAYREHELAFALNKVKARVLIMAPSLKTSDYVAILGRLAPELDRHDAAASSEPVYLAQLPALQQVVVLTSAGAEVPLPSGVTRWRDFLRGAGPAHRKRVGEIAGTLDPDDPINIQFTSGTTGTPKGATLSHFNIVNNARFTARAMRLTESDRLCLPVPLYHCFGMVLGVLACASVGAAMVFPGEAFDAPQTLRAISSTRCTALHAVPTMFVSMLESDEFSQHDLGSLRTGIMAGAPCPIEIMKRVIREMHMSQVTIAYGMTETSPVSFQSDVTDPVDRRVATVGRIHPHVEVKIVDKGGRIVAPGEQGELCTRGYSVMRGYWDEPELTNEAIDPAGWMHTGDLATIDAAGYCNIVGRVKDMLIRGGENVYPREIEEFLLTHPQIQDAQVFGIPHDRYGEEVCAWVISNPSNSSNPQDALTEASILTFCSGRIAHFKVPGKIRIVDQFPMTVTGKPQKFEMRQQMMRELGLSNVASA